MILFHVIFLGCAVHGQPRVLAQRISVLFTSWRQTRRRAERIVQEEVGEWGSSSSSSSSSLEHDAGERQGPAKPWRSQGRGPGDEGILGLFFVVSWRKVKRTAFLLQLMLIISIIKMFYTCHIKVTCVSTEACHVKKEKKYKSSTATVVFRIFDWPKEKTKQLFVSTNTAKGGRGAG